MDLTILKSARTFTPDGIHQVHFSSGGSSLLLLGNRRTLINFKEERSLVIVRECNTVECIIKSLLNLFHTLFLC